MNPQVTATGLPEGFTCEATAAGGQTDVGEHANEVRDGYKFFDADGNDKTANFTNVTKVDGTLKVTPAPLTITTGSASKPYDGTALTNEEVSITGLVNSEIARVTATGTITEVGSATNTYSIDWVTGSASNYTITEELGTLTITENSDKVTLTAASGTKVYDGKALTNAAVTAEGLPEGFTIEATASGSQTDAGNSKNVVNDGYKIFDADGNDKTASFTNVSKVEGTLTVTPKEVTITTGSGSKAYDGTPLTNAEVSIEGLVEGEGVALAATGTITEVGSTENTYDITWDNAKAANYTVTEELGTLTITENSSKVTLTAASGSKPYDGTPLTDATVTAAGLPDGFTIEATARGSQTKAGSSDNVVNTGYKIFDAEGNDKTDNFTNIELVKGTLTITQKDVTFTADSNSKEYDGTPLTDDGSTNTGLAAGDTAKVVVEGSQTVVGIAENVIKSILIENAEGEDVTASYNIQQANGELEVTAKALTITADSASKVYDGKVLTKDSYTNTDLAEGDKIESVKIEGSQTLVGSSDNVVSEAKIVNAAGEDVTGSYTITYAKGTLTVTDGTPDEPVDDKLVVTKSVDGKTYAAGQTVTFDVTATNIYATPRTITLSEIEGVTLAKSSFDNVPAGESVSTTATYTITEADVLKGSFTNTVTAKVGDITKTATATAETEKASGHITIEKVTTSKPKDGKAYALGETIKYQITAKNDGNLTITNITVSDELTGDTWTIASLAPDASKTFEAQYVVKEADILAGKVVNVATATGKSPDPDDPDVPVTPGEDPEPTVDPNGHITINKVTTSKPANGTAYALGETIKYQITAKNDGNLTITNIEVKDDLTGDKWTVESLAPGATETFTTQYVVKEADILAGSVKNVATATGTSPDPDKPDVPVTPGEKEEPTDTPDGFITVVKTTTSTPANGEKYALGETIEYEITATNTGNVTVTDVKVTDELTGDAWEAGNLAPKDSKTFTAKHVVTEADILKGSVLNTAVAEGKDPTDDGPGTTPGVKEDPTVEPVSHITIVKKATSTPANGKTYALGEKITYSITATNDGNMTLSGVTVKDDLTGKSWPISSFKPGDTQTFETEYVVTENDILAGKVVNVATATGKDPKGDEPGVTNGTEEKPTDDKNGHIKVDKTTTSKPANGSSYALGETITYEITAKNDGNLTVTGITVSDELTGDQWTVNKLAPGESKSFTAKHTVTEADVVAGKVLNVATAKGTSPDPDKPDVPVTPGEKEDPTDTQKPGISVTKTASAASGVTEGTAVTYTIVVRNTGNVTLRNVNVSDSLVSFSGNSGTIASLAPGATATLTYGYTVTAANVAAGAVINTATATGTAPNGATPTASDSVTVGTQATPGTTPTPGGGGGPGGGPGGGGPGAPGVAAPAAGAPAAAIAEQPVPEVAPEVEIEEPETPLAEGTWALLNLIAAILTTLGAVVALFRKKEEDDEDEEDQNKPKTDDEDEDDNRGKKMLASKIAGAVAGVAAPIAFILTEDMTLPMAMTDKWTLLMAALLAAQVVAAVFNKKASELDDEEEEAEAEATN